MSRAELNRLRWHETQQQKRRRETKQAKASRTHRLWVLATIAALVRWLAVMSAIAKTMIHNWPNGRHFVGAE